MSFMTVSSQDLRKTLMFFLANTVAFRRHVEPTVMAAEMFKSVNTEKQKGND